MELTYKYAQDVGFAPFIIRESGLDYACTALLLRNIGEKKDTTSLEREALSVAIRILQRDKDKRSNV